MKCIKKIMMLCLLTSVKYAVSDTLMHDLSPNPNAPEPIASPSCWQIRRECAPTYPDIKRLDAFNHCVGKKLTSICREQYNQPDQQSLYNTCITTDCGQYEQTDSNQVKRSVDRRMTQGMFIAGDQGDDVARVNASPKDQNDVAEQLESDDFVDESKDIETTNNNVSL